MSRILPLVLISLLVPTSVFAADTPSPFSLGRSLLVASSSPGNLYLGGMSVVVTAPVAGDLSAVGGGVIVASPIGGDGLFFAGSVSSRAPVAGDLRVAGGSVSIEKPIQGDLVALGLSVYESGRVGGSVFIAALNAALVNGASGPVTIYGNNVSLAGDFAGDVTLVASGRVTLAASTTIAGRLSYEAPEMADLPASARVVGGVEYKNVSYVPDIGTSRLVSLASVGLFLLVRILGALILAGLLAGLFPEFASTLVGRASSGNVRSILLTLLLGFAILVATPILFVVLMLTFVGIGIALLIFIVYFLLAFLSLIYAGILLGGMFARRYMRRTEVLWHDGVLGMLALSVISLIPVVGLFAVSLLTFFSAGALLTIFFNFAFSSSD